MQLLLENFQNRKFHLKVDKMNLSTLIKKYKEKEHEIEKRILEFKKNQKNLNSITEELAFCIFAANSKAIAAYRAQKELASSKLLDSNNAKKISFILKKSGVRFHNKKAKYFILSKKRLLTKEFLEIIKKTKNEFELREFVIKNSLGLGLKEASHFLRNIHLCSNLAILDRHILKKLKEYKIIKKIPKNLNRKNYLEIEKRMQRFSKKIKIPLNRLDLYFWSEQTGYIFK